MPNIYKRIAVDVTPVLPAGVNGGAKTLVFAMLPELAKRDPNLEYHLVTLPSNAHLFEPLYKIGIKRIVVEPLPFPLHPYPWIKKIQHRKRTWHYYKPNGILRRHKIDLLFCPFAAATYAEHGIPTVTSVYDIQHAYYPQFFDGMELACRNYFYAELLKRATLWIASTHYTKKSLIEKLGIPSEKIIPIGLDIHKRLAVPDAEKSKTVLSTWGLEGKKYFFYPGNFWKHKNHLTLLSAFYFFRQNTDFQDWHLVFSGAEIEDKNPIVQFAEKLNIKPFVHFLGYVSEEEMASLWSGAHCLVFPSLFEGFGIPMVEAMHFGKPILASQDTCLPEVGGNAAIYFNPRSAQDITNALIRIATDSELYQQLKINGQEQLKKNSQDMIGQYIQVFHKIFKGQAS